MNLADILQKFNFSIWQVVIVGIFLYFRHEIKELFVIVKTLKVGNFQLDLSGESKDSYEELKKIKRILLLKSGNNQEAIKYIDDHIKIKLVNALVNLRNATKYLWEELSAENHKQSFFTEVKSTTYKCIEDDLYFLKKEGFLDFEYDVTNQFHSEFQVFEIKIFDISNDLHELIQIAKLI